MISIVKKIVKNKFPFFYSFLKKIKNNKLNIPNIRPFLKNKTKKFLKIIFFKYFKYLVIPIYDYIINKRSKYFQNSYYLKSHNFIEIPKVKKEKINYDLSIVIPSYCRSLQTKKYLIYALNKLRAAIKRAKLINYEIILFDNNSTIEIKSLENQFEDINLKYVNSNSEVLLKPYLSWCEAVNNASGKYIFLHSDDDFVYEDFFIEINEKMKNDDKIELFYWRAKGMTNEFYDVTEFCWYWNWPRKESGYFVPAKGFLRHPMPSSGWILKREFFENYGVVGAPDEGSDYNLGVRMTKYVKKAYFCFNSISAYRHHDMQGNKLDEPTNDEAIRWRLDTTKIFYNIFEKEDAKNFSIEYIKYYAWLHGFKGIFDQHIKENNYNNCSKVGKFLYGKFWNKPFYYFHKYILSNLSKEEFMINDIRVAQPKFKIKY